MIIKDLSLHNFGIIKDANLEFKKGINLILGDNGNGKTHILKAIAFMLINHTEKTIADYCNWGYSNFRLLMNLTHHNKDFAFDYKYERKGNKLERIVNIGGDEFYNSDAVKELANYFDPILCKASILSFQGKIDLVDSKPAERRESLKKIYNLNFDNHVKEADNEIKTLESTQLADIKNNIFALQNYQYDYKEIKLLPFSKEEYQQFLAREKELNNYISLYEQQKQLYLTIKKQIEEYQSNLNSLIQEMNKVDSTIIELDTAFKSLEQQIETLNNSTTIESLQKEINDLVFVRLPVIEPVLEELEKVKKELEIINADVRIAKSSLDVAKQGKCPTCHRDFEVKEIEQYEINYTDLKETQEILQKKLQELEEKYKEYEEKKKLNEELQYKKEILLSKIENEKKTLQIQKESLEKEKIMTLSQKSNILQRKEKLQNDIESIKNKIKELHTQLPDKEPIMNDGVMKEYIEVKQKINSYEETVKYNEFVEEHNKKINELKKENEVKLKEYFKKQQEIQDKIDMLKNYKIILQKEFPNFVIDNMLGTIEYGINEVVQKIYDGRYIVKMKKTKSGIDVVYGEKEASIEIASGFEKELFNLGYKHAFSQISNLGVLFLDEIDSFASENNSMKIFQLIGELKDIYNQVFVITHKQLVQDILLMEYNAKGFYVENGVVSEI